MHYYMYQITNKVNGKIYVGVHKTKSLDDGYMGSGRIIRSAIQKHGISNFSKVILETFDTSEAMYAREAEVVDDKFLSRDDVYNLRRGGYGGFDHINREGKNVDLTMQRMNDPTLLKRSIDQAKDGYQAWKQNVGDDEISKRARHAASFSSGFEGMTHTPDTKKQIGLTMSKKQNGEKNSQFGSMWITNGTENKKIKVSSPIQDGWRRGRTFGS